MRSLALITFGCLLTLLLVRDIRAGGAAYLKGTSSRAFRVFYWCLISGLIAGGLFGAVDERAAFALVMLGALAGGAWILGVILIMIVAPTYAARIVYYPMSVALRHHPFATPPLSGAGRAGSQSLLSLGDRPCACRCLRLHCLDAVARGLDCTHGLSHRPRHTLLSVPGEKEAVDGLVA